jgi:hypothetical protein
VWCVWIVKLSFAMIVYPMTPLAQCVIVWWVGRVV